MHPLDLKVNVGRFQTGATVPIANRCGLPNANNVHKHDSRIKTDLCTSSTLQPRVHCSILAGLARRPCTRMRMHACSCRALKGKQDVSSPELEAAKLDRLQDVRWVPTLAVLAALGALLGPPMDGFHSYVGLLEYDQLPVTLGSWRTSLVDVPLLALYYSVAGSLLLVLDRLWPSKVPPPQPSAASVALQFGLLAAFLQLSAVMYDGGTPYSQIWAVLGVSAVVGWRITDNTKQAAALGLLSFAVCPVAEALLMRFAGVWHYPRADLLIGGEGFTSWTACCYMFYTISLAPLARYIVATTSQSPPS